MAKSIKPDALHDAIKKELTMYHDRVVSKVNNLSEQAAKTLVKKTRTTAPVKTGSYYRNIASKEVKSSPFGKTYAWYVKAPDYRLTHLLVKPHATVNGKRTTPDPFLQNALNEVLPDYEKNVEEALKDD